MLFHILISMYQYIFDIDAWIRRFDISITILNVTFFVKWTKITTFFLNQKFVPYNDQNFLSRHAIIFFCLPFSAKNSFGLNNRINWELLQASQPLNANVDDQMRINIRKYIFPTWKGWGKKWYANNFCVKSRREFGWAKRDYRVYGIHSEFQLIFWKETMMRVKKAFTRSSEHYLCMDLVLSIGNYKVSCSAPVESSFCLL